MQRRSLLRAAAALPVAALARPTLAARAPVKGQVIVVGGGMAGASLAKYLRLWDRGIGVTLVERRPSYTSNIMSSLVLTGQRSLSSLDYGYQKLRRRGAQVLQGEIVALDTGRARVQLADGTWLAGDQVVLAPGIDFERPPGDYDDQAMPHAWQAGPQTQLLADQLAAMPAGGTVLLTIPPTPYRCPPGPYERACLLADWLRGHKPGSRLIVLDANPDIVVEQDNFSSAFYGLHADVLDYRPGAVITAVDAATMTVDTAVGRFQGDVINLIPRQRAPALLRDAGLATANGGRFAPVDVLNYVSTVAPAISVIGDASATTQPKAGHIANQEAKVCADALVRRFGGQAPDPAPVTNSACFSTITQTQASWLTAVFQYDTASRSMVAVPASSGASTGWSSRHFQDMNTWFNALMADSFG